jgi:hypothetical protein
MTTEKNTEPSLTISDNGNQHWRVNGVRHREDGPALTTVTGYQAWYINDLLHRIDGPAIMGPEDFLAWYIGGEDITCEVERWMELKEISWPWDDETQVEFLLTWT